MKPKRPSHRVARRELLAGAESFAAQDCPRQAASSAAKRPAPASTAAAGVDASVHAALAQKVALACLRGHKKGLWAGRSGA